VAAIQSKKELKEKEKLLLLMIMIVTFFGFYPHLYIFTIQRSVIFTLSRGMMHHSYIQFKYPKVYEHTNNVYTLAVLTLKTHIDSNFSFKYIGIDLFNLRPKYKTNK
jgi:hypothetical protein